VKVHRVGAGPATWGLLALKLALERPGLTAFLAGQKMKEAALLAKLWPFSHPIVMPTLDHVVRGLRHVARGAEELRG
jgi:hypothetical protein